MKSRGHHFEKLTGRVRSCSRVIVILLAAAGACAVRADEKDPPAEAGSAKHKSAAGKDGEGSAKKSKSEGAAGANAGLKAFGQMIPLGNRSRGVRIPAFENGKPSSLIVADAMTRVDDNRLFSEKMVIHVFAEKKDEDMRIDMKTGTYNMDHQILSSTERSRVSRADFQIEGDGMVYDTKTSQGKMVGNVEMIIYDATAASRKMNIQTGGKSAAGGQKTPDNTKPGNPVEKK